MKRMQTNQDGGLVAVESSPSAGPDGPDDRVASKTYELAVSVIQYHNQQTWTHHTL
jgi:hypothetical protein